jgi:hypothetical protein
MKLGDEHRHLSVPCRGTKEASAHNHGDVNKSQGPATLQKSVSNSVFNKYITIREL